MYEHVKGQNGNDSLRKPLTAIFVGSSSAQLVLRQMDLFAVGA
jgi:hypothetical protein